MKNTLDWVVSALFLVVALCELYFGVTGHFPGNLQGLVIGAAILCWLVVRFRKQLRK